ncbi:hypothetical protein NQ317_001173 [Molorchus minor]|uniref:THAP-type domain-containing protein n=1 Tax=Molorchus minor TaxID=1323400 RepID=A0ABQ9J1I6_9CUCU|nr:hypothetical protein NQ317_001173 [Molorchus minor]
MMPGRRCAIYGCNNSRVVTKITDCNIVYHSFPKGKDFVSSTILRRWVNYCKRGDKFNSNTATICSIHFTQNDYERDIQNELLGLPLRRVLKKTAVPILNLNLNERSKKPSKKLIDTSHAKRTKKKEEQVSGEIFIYKRKS